MLIITLADNGRPLAFEERVRRCVLKVSLFEMECVESACRHAHVCVSRESMSKSLSAPPTFTHPPVPGPQG